MLLQATMDDWVSYSAQFPMRYRCRCSDLERRRGVQKDGGSRTTFERRTRAGEMRTKGTIWPRCRGGTNSTRKASSTPGGRIRGRPAGGVPRFIREEAQPVIQDLTYRRDYDDPGRSRADFNNTCKTAIFVLMISFIYSSEVI